MNFEKETCMTYPFVSVIIPIYNEATWIDRLHTSLVNNGYPKNQLEIIYVDGGSHDRSVSVIKELLTSKDEVNTRLLFNPDRITSRSLNLAIAESSGTVILRADAHAWYEPNYIETSVRLLMAQPNLGGVGGQAKAVGLGSFWAVSIALAMNSLSGNGGTDYRIGETARYTDTIWCGCWWRETLQEVGGFNESFTTNQDYELNFRLRDSGKPLLYDPSIRANYICRDSLSKLCQQYYRYGKGRAHTLSVHPRSLQFRQLLALVPFLTTIAFFFISPWLPALSFSLMSVYLLALVLSAAREMLNGESVLVSLAMVPCLLTMHISWGAGFSIGYIEQLFSATCLRIQRGNS